MLLYIIRHGIPDYSTDTLTPHGKLQAEAVAKRLSVHGIDEIYSSPLGRAKQTAEPTSLLLNREIKIIPEFSEDIAFWKFNATTAKGTNDWAFHCNLEKMLGSDEMCQSCDSFSHGFYLDDNAAKKAYEELSIASDKFIESLGYKRRGEGNAYDGIAPNDKRIALFCHQGVGLHLISRILNIPPHIFTATFDLSFSSVTVIRFTNSEKVYPKCLCLSDLSHIYGDRLPYKYHNNLDI